jgi:hypothetical protein
VGGWMRGWDYGDACFAIKDLLDGWVGGWVGGKVLEDLLYEVSRGSQKAKQSFLQDEQLCDYSAVPPCLSVCVSARPCIRTIAGTSGSMAAACRRLARWRPCRWVGVAHASCTCMHACEL